MFYQYYYSVELWTLKKNFMEGKNTNIGKAGKNEKEAALIMQGKISGRRSPGIQEAGDILG